MITARDKNNSFILHQKGDGLVYIMLLLSYAGVPGVPGSPGRAGPRSGVTHAQ